MARIIRVILTDELRGDGTQGKPFYRQLQLWTEGGVLICKANPQVMVLTENSCTYEAESDWVNLDALQELAAKP